MSKSFTIHDLPKVDRPREKLVSKGPQNLKDEELLAILLRTGGEGKNVLEIARQILSVEAQVEELKEFAKIYKKPLDSFIR